MRQGPAGAPGPAGAAGASGGAAGPAAQCDAMLLGREPVEGAVHAASLASLVRGLAGTKARPNRQGRRYLLRCSDGGVELVARRPALQRPGGTLAGSRVDDEGFESDEDRRSTRSDDSTSVSSSCCLVEDHVFKATGPLAMVAGPAMAGLAGIVAAASSTSSDSANSSGGSDTDEVDVKPAHEPASSAEAASSAASGAGLAGGAPPPFRESFSFQDVAFCHVDAAFPRVVVLVVRRGAAAAGGAARRLRLGPLGALGPPASMASTGTGLEALVLECRGEEGVRALCSAYQELSRRARMDGQYRDRAPHRRKEDAVKEAVATTSTVVSGTVLPKFIFSKVDEAESGRFNLVQRTDGDGVTHIEVSRGGQGGASLVSVDDVAVASDGPSSIISISTPDAPSRVGSSASSSGSKEIEGVIRADVEPSASGPRHLRRPHGDEPKLWTTALTADDDLGLSGPSSLPGLGMAGMAGMAAPQRPERKRFVRKSKAPAPPAPSAAGGSASQPTSLQGLQGLQNDGTLKKKASAQQDTVMLNNTLNRVGRDGHRVVRGQFIRVSVEQQGQQQGQQGQQGKWPGSSHFPAGWTGPPPARSWGSALGAAGAAGAAFADADHRQRYQRRSRSSDSGRGQPGQPPQPRPRSPPAARRPMAYRYVDTVGPAAPAAPPQAAHAAGRAHHPGATTNSLSHRFFGLSQKLREIGGSVVGGAYPGAGLAARSIRRNSWGDAPTRFYTSLDPPLKSSSNNLKSVIKKNQGAGGAEPKKVTFSAYATVQVVD